ncbi:MAG: SpoIIIAH-like family protein [Clostridiales bacterium]|nr:SpoIIIAH-like family protein [Clostridiales bacterium]
MAVNKKKIIILCTMVVLLVASGYLNYVLTNKPTVDAVSPDTAITTYFAAAKADRQTTRNEMIAYCEAVIASPTSTAVAKADAETSRMQLIAGIEIENSVETFLFGKGYPAYIVSCMPNNINVIIADNGLDAAKVAIVKNFIIENTSYVLNQIIISRYTV